MLSKRFPITVFLLLTAVGISKPLQLCWFCAKM